MAKVTTRKARPPAVKTPDAPFTELGATGLKHSAGFIDDDFLPELRGTDRRHKLYREIRDNSPVIGGAFFAIENILRGVQLDVRPGDDTPEGADRATFTKLALEGMKQPWGATLTQALSMLAFGWSLLEVVYERRPDGYVGWRKMVIRSQESLDRWEFDDRGEVLAMWQRPAPSYQLIRIPLEKALLFTTTDAKASPEGRSLLRNCVLPWKFVKRIQVYEAIGVERGLAGIPVAWVPPEVLVGTDDAAKASYAAMKNLVVNLRRDEQEGVIMPLRYDQNGNKTYDLTLLATAGTERHDTDKIISRYEQRMLMTMLADFIMVGHEKVGSFSLASSKTDLFAIAIAAFIDAIIEQLNRVEIPRLMALNGWSEPYPQITRGDIESPDLTELGTYVKALADAGLLMPTMTGELERYLYQAGHLPVPKEMQAEDSTVNKAEAA